MREFLCTWLFWGHKWDDFAMCKRRCARCSVEEWVFTKRHPLIGEPRSEWTDMTIRPLPWRWRLRAWLAK